MKYMRFLLWISAIGMLGILGMVWASDEAVAPAEPLPEPLSLNQALNLAATTPHPQVMRLMARYAQDQARLLAAQAQTAWEISLDGSLRWVAPNPEAESEREIDSDHFIGLSARKTLFDFGRSKAQTLAADKTQASSQQQAAYARKQYQLQVMQAFFDVVLADMHYRVADETMAIAFIRLDRLRQRQQLGQSGDLAVVKQQSEYEQQLAERTRLSYEQRATRTRLALLLNRPDQLPATVVTPDIAPRQIGEVEPLLEQAMRDNLEIRALQSQLQAAKAEIEAARAQYRPQLRAVVEAYQWDRDFSARDRVRAGMELHLPLYQGQRTQAMLDQAQAHYQEIRADWELKQLEVRQQVVETWLALQGLLAQQQADQVLVQASDLSLDYQRTLYDLEFNADLGSSLVEQTHAQWRAQQTQLTIAEHWALLDLLTGHNTDAGAE